MNKLFEGSSSDELNAKDGGFIFQAILNYDLRWSIVNGETSLDQKNINGWLSQIDIFPDMKFTEGSATLSYVTISEVNLLKRKFELASEAIKRMLNPAYAKEMEGNPDEREEDSKKEEIPKPTEGDLVQDTETYLAVPINQEKTQAGLPEPSKQKQLGSGQVMLGAGQTMLQPGQTMLNTGQKMLPTSESRVDEVLYTSSLTSAQIKEINSKYFKDTQYDVRFTVQGIVLREVSTSGIDSGAPSIVLKLSTGMVDTLDGSAINSWDKFKVVVTGGRNKLVINNSTTPKISEILVYDTIENINELIFRTILPSLILQFTGDRVQIDNYSNRSSQISIRSNIDFDNLFNIEDAPKSEIVEPIEGEETEEVEEVEPVEDIDQTEEDEILKNNINK